MKKSAILILGSIGFWLGSASVTWADDDQKHPGYHFEPVVVYQDAQITQTNNAATTKADPEYPAVYFEPKVIYQDKELIKAY
ncbi:hypothetical protein [Methylocaldum sp.]|uniref:hypothetical protein n=1 Tax=Methylocaldum sp. TaxID=1969727 RepID=UPI002D70C713|nr:hypothetical protein [Methylocaldum sp.]HYE34482.1 hypothetical protein [Methylocaldum sp.]